MEKRRLEELLQQIPEESVAAQRHAKIAAAMGTRTPMQVASRMQKMAMKASARASSIRELAQIDDALARFDGLVKRMSKTRKAECAKDLALLERMRAQMLRARDILVSAKVTPIHWGVACFACGIEPLIGVKWQCLECTPAGPTTTAVDAFVPKTFCEECRLKAALAEDDQHGQSILGVCHDHRLTRYEIPDYRLPQIAGFSTTASVGMSSSAAAAAALAVPSPGVGMWPQRLEEVFDDEYAYLDPSRPAKPAAIVHLPTSLK